jgi:serine/threonine-protein kinase RsbW
MVHGTWMPDLPNVRLDLANRPENVLLVREMLTGVAEAIDLDPDGLNHVRTAVTEACNNVVRHAYGGREGPLEVEVDVASDALEVVVRDQGVGVDHHRGAPDGTTLGVGLPVIRALVSRVEFRDAAGGGTEVWMEFAAPEIRAPDSIARDPVEPLAIAQAELAARAVATVTTAPTELAHTVLPRMLSVLAARAHFSTDRILDAHLLADELVAQAARSISASRFDIALELEPRTLDLHVGPLDVGDAQRLIGASNREGLGRVLASLTNCHRVVPMGSYEVLSLGLTARR